MEMRGVYYREIQVMSERGLKKKKSLDLMDGRLSLVKLGDLIFELQASRGMSNYLLDRCHALNTPSVSPGIKRFTIGQV